MVRGLCFWTGTSLGKIMAASTILYYTASVCTCHSESFWLSVICALIVSHVYDN